MIGKVSWKIYGVAGVFLLAVGMFVLAGDFASIPCDETALVLSLIHI